MGSQKYLRPKAARVVFDLTTSLLNPVSDQICPHHDEVEMTAAQDTLPPESELLDHNAGPDTSSFVAFLCSLLSADSSVRHFNDEGSRNCVESDLLPSKSRSKVESLRRSLLPLKGRQLLGRPSTQRVEKNIEICHDIDTPNENLKNGESSDKNSTGCELNTSVATWEAASGLHLPDISELSVLLSETTRCTLSLSLPSAIREMKWVLLYSTWKHGTSLSTMYRRSTLCPGHCLLVVGDKEGATFGGLVEAPLKPTNKRKFQGTYNSFVFTDISGHPVVFHPTGANRYFTLCFTDFLALGGGDHFALYLDGDLLNGSSYASETFGNPCLACTSEFEVKEVELWGFMHTSKYGKRELFDPSEATGVCRW